MPNSFAYLMLIAWPALAAMLYRLLPLERALIWSILGAYLILPPKTAFDLPMIPPLDKVSLPNLAALACCLVVCGRQLSFRPASLVATLLLVVFVAGPFATVLTNSEPAFYGSFMLPGLRIYDAVSAIANQLIFLLPFFLARSLLASETAQRELVIALMIAGLVYSIPMLVEVRLSPQLNTWIYGFFQHTFAQMMRNDGFRPIVFLDHGLLVAFLAMMSFVAALAMLRWSDSSARTMIALECGYLAVLLFLCKSWGAIIFAICLLPLVLLAGKRVQIRVAAVLAILAFCYPLMRGADLVPVEAILEKTEQMSPERAQSLQVRFDNEAALLERANLKPLFGWGGWGRNRIFDETGQDRSVTDGGWIIFMGFHGWSGYVAQFGLLGLPLILLALRATRTDVARLSPWTGPLALLLAVNIMDLIPNASLTPFTWLICGALLGYAERLRTQDDPAVARRPRMILDPGGPRDGPRTVL